MLSIEEFRKTSPKFKDLSDAEVTKMRDDMDKLADIVFDQWLAKRNKGKGSIKEARPPASP